MVLSFSAFKHCTLESICLLDGFLNPRSMIHITELGETARFFYKLGLWLLRQLFFNTFPRLIKPTAHSRWGANVVTESTVEGLVVRARVSLQPSISSNAALASRP